MQNKKAMRKHTLRIDLRIYPGNEEAHTMSDPEIESKIKSLLTAAIIKGLDVVGVVSKHGPHVGQIAKQVALNNKLDLYVLGGQELTTIDKFRLIAYDINEIMPANLDLLSTLNFIKQKKGKSMVFNVGKAQAKMLDQLKESGSGPDFIEIYDASKGGFQDLDIHYPKFVSTASESNSDLQHRQAYTLMSRKTAEKLGLIPQNYGVDYMPAYLQADLGAQT